MGRAVCLRIPGCTWGCSPTAGTCRSRPASGDGPFSPRTTCQPLSRMIPLRGTRAAPEGRSGGRGWVLRFQGPCRKLTCSNACFSPAHCTLQRRALKNPRFDHFFEWVALAVPQGNCLVPMPFLGPSSGPTAQGDQIQFRFHVVTGILLSGSQDRTRTQSFGGFPSQCTKLRRRVEIAASLPGVPREELM